MGFSLGNVARFGPNPTPTRLQGVGCLLHGRVAHFATATLRQDGISHDAPLGWAVRLKDSEVPKRTAKKSGGMR